MAKEKSWSQRLQLLLVCLLPDWVTQTKGDGCYLQLVSSVQNSVQYTWCTHCHEIRWKKTDFRKILCLSCNENQLEAVNLQALFLCLSPEEGAFEEQLLLFSRRCKSSQFQLTYTSQHIYVGKMHTEQRSNRDQRGNPADTMFRTPGSKIWRTLHQQIWVFGEKLGWRYRRQGVETAPASSLAFPCCSTQST